jgi:hypothetical protein
MTDPKICEARMQAATVMDSANRVLDATAKLIKCYAETIKVIAEESEKLGMPDPIARPASNGQPALTHAA